MRAEVRSLTTVDFGDLEKYDPEVFDNFCVAIRVMVGPYGAPGEESFDAFVCTTKWLEQELQAAEILLARHYLIVRTFNYEVLRKFIEQYVRRCEGDSWEEVARKVGYLGRWEFENYQA